MDLEVGKTYLLEYNAGEASAVYLMKYHRYESEGINANSFVSYTALSTGSGVRTKEIVPEEGYIYTILFANVSNTSKEPGTWTDIKLTEAGGDG